MMCIPKKNDIVPEIKIVLFPWGIYEREDSGYYGNAIITTGNKKAEVLITNNQADKLLDMGVEELC